MTISNLGGGFSLSRTMFCGGIIRRFWRARISGASVRMKHLTLVATRIICAVNRIIYVVAF